MIAKCFHFSQFTFSYTLFSSPRRFSSSETHKRVISSFQSVQDVSFFDRLLDHLEILLDVSIPSLFHAFRLVKPRCTPQSSLYNPNSNPFEIICTKLPSRPSKKTKKRKYSKRFRRITSFVPTSKLLEFDGFNVETAGKFASHQALRKKLLFLHFGGVDRAEFSREFVSACRFASYTQRTSFIESKADR